MKKPVREYIKLRRLACAYKSLADKKRRILDIVLEFNRKKLLQPILFMGFMGIIPIEGQMPLGEATGVDMPVQVWEKFHQEKQRIPRIEGGRELGVAYLGDVPEGYFTYFAGAEVMQGTEDSRFDK